MASRPSNNGHRRLPTYIPLQQAARLTGLPLSALQKRVETGTIAAIQLPDGEIAVSEHDAQRAVPKEELPEYKKGVHLRGVSISISDAAEKYTIPTPTISRWVQRGYIKRLGQDGRKVLIDEADIAYCAKVYLNRRGQGRWVFNPDGTPYSPKSHDTA